jgi:RNA polymerase sigma factor (sigma-70 family)
VVISNLDATPPVDSGDEFLRSIESKARKMVRLRVVKYHLPWSYADDVSQEVLLRIVQHLEALRAAQDDRRDAWLLITTRNVVSNAAREWHRSRDIESRWPGAHRLSGPIDEGDGGPFVPEELVVSPDAGPEMEAIVHEFRRAFVCAFNRLPARYRGVLNQWLILGESCSEIARRDGRTRSVIDRLISSGLSLLATYLPGFAEL